MTDKQKIRKINSLTGTVLLPESFRERLEEKVTWLAFSTRRTPCQVIFKPDANTVEVSEDLWDALALPHEMDCHLFFQGTTLHLGPLIGIFTAGFTDQLLRPIGERSRFFAKYLSLSDEVGAFCCVFGCHHIHWDEGTIDGYFYRKEGWEKRTVPFPDVIYDRLPNRRTEQLSQFRQTKQRMQEDYLIPWFNPGFFDKWNIHELLQTDYRARHYLPQTHNAPSQELIESMLQTYRHVYLKPARGSLGLGIHQIIKSKEKEGYYCRFHDGEASRLRRFDSIESLIRQQLPQGRLEQLLVQQGIDLLQWQNRAVDFRVHTNKNEEGKWVVSTVAAKVAGSGSVTTHIKYGGEVKMVDEVFGMGPAKEGATAKLKQASLAISAVIEEKMEGTIGEIGFDLGIDHEGQVWLFEANAKPGRHIFTHPKLRVADQQSRKLPLAFAVFLARNAILEPAAIYA
ncbi:MAG TPA: YheC/YheD family protein [Bacillales bacterium]|nr:YheC/YheD family protein [Bacillales bacterium]